MKNLIFISLLALATNLQSQNTYPWPSNGNIGIGTNSPSGKLQVITNTPNDGAEIMQTNNGFCHLRLTNATSGGHPWSLISTGLGNSEGAGNFFLFDYSNFSYRMFFNGNTGTMTFGNPFLSGATNQAKVNIQINGSNPALDVFDQGSSTVLFRVWNNGKTVIGKPLQGASPYNSTSLLTINGQAVCKEMIITQQYWSDFVFDEKYELMPLKELENFYKKNHHLPQIPSAGEIAEAGNDLGRTDAQLLQKIEELTLYLVDQNKANEQLKKQVAELQKQMLDLKAAMKH